MYSTTPWCFTAAACVQKLFCARVHNKFWFTVNVGLSFIGDLDLLGLKQAHLFRYFLFPLLCTDLTWYDTQGVQTAVSSSRPFLLPCNALMHTQNPRMIAQSHVNAVSFALCAPSTAHNSLCQCAFQTRRKPFSVIPGWSETARPGVLCSQSICRRTQLS